MTDYSFDAQMLEQMRRLKGLLPCCPNCEHFVSHVIMDAGRIAGGTLPTTNESCGLDPERRRPPARIIAFGCPAFTPGVPF